MNKNIHLTQQVFGLLILWGSWMNESCDNLRPDKIDFVVECDNDLVEEKDQRPNYQEIKSEWWTNKSQW